MSTQSMLSRSSSLSSSSWSFSGSPWLRLPPCVSSMLCAGVLPWQTSSWRLGIAASLSKNDKRSSSQPSTSIVGLSCFSARGHQATPALRESPTPSSPNSSTLLDNEVHDVTDTDSNFVGSLPSSCLGALRFQPLPDLPLPDFPFPNIFPGPLPLPASSLARPSAKPLAARLSASAAKLLGGTYLSPSAMPFCPDLITSIDISS
mmetsp:Transcript_5186/g.12418  ORF Transcript_5186/g.12418 Transcript_5186/m.12418 type:complete len:204 (-) Transcript_5186:1032-1643(-)